MTESRQSPQERLSWIRGLAKQLHRGDRVNIETGRTERTLTVTEDALYVDREPYRCNGLVVEFDGYGTTYELEVPEPSYGLPATLRYPSSPTLGEAVKDMRVADGLTVGLVSEQTAGDLGIPRR